MSMRRFQTVMGLGILLGFAACVLALSLLSRSEPLRRWAEGPELERFKAGGGIFMNRGHFVDFEERLLVDEIPSTDFTRGGVYFFGTSTSKWAMRTWELPAQERTLIHNFGTGASNHRYVGQFIRFLDSEHGLLKPGAGKVHVVIGCFWTMGKDWRNGFFSQLWARQGLYEHDEQAGIRASHPNLHDWEVTIKREQARLAGFVIENTRRGLRFAAAAAGVKMQGDGARRLRPEDVRQRATENADIPNWPRELQEQEAAFADTLNFLRERGIGVSVVLLPTRTVYHGMDKPMQYDAMVRSVSAAQGVELIDLSRLLADDEFVDVHHANYQGLARLDEALAQLARRHLAKAPAVTTP